MGAPLAPLLLPDRRSPTYSYTEAAQRAPPRSREMDLGIGRSDMRREQTSGTLSDWQQIEMDCHTTSIPSA
ncbi:hypothetical protein O3P69_013177 [Scylla paramamosain]|uniref:Uncharacterized protein n=1 Tax=Scylla paramamosain TaxID=85552 RepID=A0AAW0U083_SCYPA